MNKEDIVHLYNRVLLSHKKECSDAICSNIDGPRDYHIKWSKPEKNKYHMISLICGIPPQNDTNKVIYKAEIHPQT